MSLVKQVEEGGIREPAFEIQAQRLVERLPMPVDIRIQITAKGSVEDGLEKAD